MAKSSSQSDVYRQIGNQLFSKKTFPEALDAYGKGVLYAPASSESLAYAFGNRSAVLYELKLFKACLRDIERAISCRDCPTGLRDKLLCRKVKCEADQLALDRASAVSEDVFEKLPAIEGGRNNRLNGASNKIALEFKTELGRRLVATEAIEPGSVIIVERPFASSLRVQSRTDHCYGCYRSLPRDYIPCISCVEIRYCSEECLENDRKSHAWECGLLECLDGETSASLAYKMFALSSSEELAETFHCKHRGSCADDLTPSDGSYGVPPDAPYDGGFMSVWNLTTHHEEIKAMGSRMQKNLNQAVLLSELASSRKQQKWSPMVRELFELSSNICDVCKSLSPDKKAKLVNKHINSLRISGCPGSTYQDRKCDISGVESYEPLVRAKRLRGVSELPLDFFFSKITAILLVGKTMAIRATSTIKPGEEVRISYSPVFGEVPILQRKELLKQTYFFDCACSACTEPEFVERENCLSAVNCRSCPKSIAEIPQGCFYSEKDIQPRSIPMFKNEAGDEYVCSRCSAHVSISAIQWGKGTLLKELRSAMERTSDHQKATRDVMNAYIPLRSILYVHNNELSEWRNCMAIWMMQQGADVKALGLMELELFTFAFKFGDNSIYLAIRIYKFFQRISNLLALKRESARAIHLFVRRGSERLTQLHEKAVKIIEIHSGKDFVVIKDLNKIVNTILVGSTNDATAVESK